MGFHTSRDAFLEQLNSVQAFWFEYNLVENSVHWDESLLRSLGLDNALPYSDFAALFDPPLPTIHQLTSPLSVVVEIKSDRSNIYCISIYPKSVDTVVTHLYGTVREFSQVVNILNRVDSLVDRLHASNEQMKDTIRIISHDFRAPLRQIMVYLPNVTMEICRSCPLSGDSIIATERVKAGVESLDTILERILMFIQNTDTSLEFQTLDFDDLVSEAEKEVQILNPFFSASGKTGVQVRGDKFQLHSLLVNLFKNSIQYAHPERYPQVRIWEENQQIHFLDNGVGFPEDASDKIFRLFWRSEESKEREPTGTGMGLTLCRRIMANHGGTIRAVGVPGKGAEFILGFNGHFLGRVSDVQ